MKQADEKVLRDWVADCYSQDGMTSEDCKIAMSFLSLKHPDKSLGGDLVFLVNHYVAELEAQNGRMKDALQFVPAGLNWAIRKANALSGITREPQEPSQS